MPFAAAVEWRGLEAEPWSARHPPRTAQPEPFSRVRCSILRGALAPQSVAAAERSCKRPLGAITVDNLRVPENASCTLTGTRVRGTISVQRNATLVARGVRVFGNVQAGRAFWVVIRAWPRFGGSFIAGSVQVKQSGTVSVTRSRTEGDSQLEANRRFLRANDNRVRGNLQLFGNTGGAAVFRNTVVGNIQCKDNRPNPTGADNIVGGSKEDQCRRF